MLSNQWMWLYFGAFLMLAELLAPGFVIFFFGLSAATVGIAVTILGEGFSLTWQLIAFSALSILYLVFLRRWLKNLFAGKAETSPVDFDHERVGKMAKVVEAINPPLTGRIILGDAEWSANADKAIKVGADVKVVEQNNLTLKVEEVV